jgi:hypothetical protein
MPVYPLDQLHQQLLTAYDEAKRKFKAAKAERKSLETSINAPNLGNPASSPTVPSYQYRKALSQEKMNKMKVHIAKARLKARVKSLKEPKRGGKIEGIETLLFRYKYGF